MIFNDKLHWICLYLIVYCGLNLIKISKEKGVKIGPDGSSLLQKEQKVD